MKNHITGYRVAGKPCGCASAACIVHPTVNSNSWRRDYEGAGYVVSMTRTPPMTVRCQHGPIEDQR